jgi:membrane fusion protein (multidrug efflux system)
MKWIKWILEIVIGVGLLVWSVRLVITTEPTRAGTKKKAGQVVNVVVQSLKKMKIEDSLICLGTVVARESVEISAQVTEKITAIHFDHGQHVKKGDLLVELQSAQEQAAISVTELAIAEHQREEERLAWLLKEDAIPQKELDDRRTRLAIAKAEKVKAEADCADRKIVAPFSGVVGLRLVSLGDLVSPGTKITTLDDIEQVYVDYPVPEKYTAKLKEGMPFKAVNIAYEGVEFQGTIRMVDPRVQAQTRSAQVRGVIDNKEQRLRPGMLMTVKLNMGVEECQSLPEEALTSLGEKHYVFVYVAEQKKVFRKEVMVGRRTEGRVEVVSGLDAHAVVVTEGVAKIADGQQVTVEERK